MKTTTALDRSTQTAATQTPALEAAPPPAAEPAGKTKLQVHVDFFAERSDKPGVVSVGATYRGARDLGMDLVSSGIIGVAIPAGLAKATTGKVWPLEVSVANIAGGKHSGDSGVYDTNGHFVQAKFDQLWARHDPSGKGYLTAAEIDHMIQTNSPAKDGGRVTSTLEFQLLAVMGSEINVAGEHVLTKATLGRFYQEGFGFLAERRQAALEGHLDEDLRRLTVARGATNGASASIVGANQLRVPLDGEKTKQELARRKSVLPTLVAAIRNRTAPQPTDVKPASED
ncbi:caleosin family protein [Myxococcota bacterium]|nr:caleosin family protein [Myxococcota bacterium]